MEQDDTICYCFHITKRKILNFIRLRQRKEGMRDVRSLLAQALEVDSAQLRFQELFREVPAT